jgi:hypothetical protein
MKSITGANRTLNEKAIRSVNVCFAFFGLALAVLCFVAAFTLGFSIAQALRNL